MKNTLTKLALIAALALIADGCSSQITPPTPAGWQAIAEVAARDGAGIYLVRHPDNHTARAAFVITVQNLNMLIADGKFSHAELHAALAELPVKALNGATGIIVIDTATVLYQALTGGRSVIESAPVVKAFAIGIRDGLQSALNQ